MTLRIPKTLLAILVASILPAALASAALLNLTLSDPAIVFDSQGSTEYDADSNLLIVEATPLVIREVSGTITPITGLHRAAPSFSIAVVVDGAGMLVGGVSGPDLQVTGTVDLGTTGFFSGVLLEGEVIEFGFRDSGGTTDDFEFVFVPTGGLLAFLYSGADLGVSLNSERSSFSNFHDDFNGGAKGTLGALPGLECDIDVTKTCCIPPPPSANGGEDCDGKVLEAVFRYTGGSCADTSNGQEGKAKCEGETFGSDPVDIFITNDEDKVSAVPATGIGVGETFAIGKKDGELGSSTEFDLVGPAGTQSLEVHTSCSKPLNVGDVFGGVQLVELTTTDGGTVRLPDPDQNESLCRPPGDGEGIACDERPVEVKFEYTGADCSASDNPQEDKAKCSGDPGSQQPVTIVYTGKDPNKISVTPSTVSVGEVFALTATDRDELHSNSIFEIRNGGVLQELEIHTSCSKTLALGDNFGALRVVGFTEKTGVVRELVPPDPIEPTSECSVPAQPPGPHCTSKVEVLSLRYLGGDCSETTNSQEGKAECSGDTASAEPVRIVARDGSDVVLDQRGVSLGDVVSIVADGDKLGSETSVEIFAGSRRIQELEIHTSCSKRLDVGDRFGALEVFGLDPTEGPPIAMGGVVEYQIVVSNPGGTTLDDVHVDDEQLGEIASGLSLAPGDSRTFFRTALVSEDVMSTVRVEGKQGARVCEDSAKTTVTVVEPPPPGRSCEDGDPIALTFEYTGASCAATNNPQEGKAECSGDPADASPVSVVMLEDEDKVDVTPAQVPLGGLVTLSRDDGKSFSSETVFAIRQGSRTLQTLNIHTSCSKDLEEGDQFGSMLLRVFVPE